MADVAETIEESGRRIGHHAWVEARLFEVVGRWAGTVAEPRSRALFSRQSAHHAWHVELWHGLLPALPHVSDTQLVAPGGTDAETVAALAAFDEPADAGPDSSERGHRDDAVARLVALYRDALPELVAVYDDHLAHTSPVADGPTMRVLRLVRADLAEDAAAGEALIAALESPPGPPD
jgi:hypothetical protein